METNVQEWLEKPANYDFEEGQVACFQDMLSFMGFPAAQIEGVSEDDMPTMPWLPEEQHHIFESDGWVHHTYTVDGGWIGYFEDSFTGPYKYFYQRV